MHLIFVMATEYKSDNGQALYYVCAIKNGSVTVDGDVMAELDVIETLYNQNYSEMTADLESSDIDIYGAGVEEVGFPGINQVTPDHVLDRALRYSSQATIAVLGKAGLSKLSVAMLVILFVAGSYFVYELFLKPTPPPVVAAPVQQPVQVAEPQVDPRVQFLANFASRLESEPTAAIIPSLVDTVKQLPMGLGGWKIDTIDFNGNNASTLSMTLSRTSYGSVDQVLGRKELGFFTSVNMDPQGNDATVSYPMHGASAMRIPGQRLEILSDTGSPIYYSLVNTLQMHGLPFSVNNLSSNNYFSEAKITFSGSGLWSLMDLYEVLAPFDTFSISSIQIQTNDGQNDWKIEGNIYG